MKSQPLFLGIDLGGSKTLFGIVDNSMRIIRTARVATDAPQGPEALFKRIMTLLQREKISLSEVSCCGVGVAGQVNSETGVLLHGPNLGWRNVNLGAVVEKILGLKTVLTNDVRAVTLGEWKYGAGRGCDNVVCLLFGTGIGGGIVAEGRLVQGETGCAGEAGHITVVPRGRPCHCGGRGCWEAYAGGRAIAQRAREELESCSEKTRLDVNLADLDAKSVIDAAGREERWAVKVLKQTERYLPAGVISIVNLLNPRRIILGGGLIEGVPGWVDLIKKEVHRSALKSATGTLEIVPAELGAEAGVIGAAVLAENVLLC